MALTHMAVNMLAQARLPLAALSHCSTHFFVQVNVVHDQSGLDGLVAEYNQVG
jgi:hypothetical protein